MLESWIRYETVWVILPIFRVFYSRKNNLFEKKTVCFSFMYNPTVFDLLKLAIDRFVCSSLNKKGLKEFLVGLPSISLMTMNLQTELYPAYKFRPWTGQFDKGSTVTSTMTNVYIFRWRLNKTSSSNPVLAYRLYNRE